MKKTLPKLKADLQKVFNEFIRLRDAGKPCISCGNITTLQAGHFYSVKTYDGLRFNPDNVHGECVRDNLFDDMHLLQYQINLTDRIGEKRYKDLVNASKAYKANGYKWSRSELEELISFYKAKVKEMKF